MKEGVGRQGDRVERTRSGERREEVRQLLCPNSVKTCFNILTHVTINVVDPFYRWKDLGTVRLSGLLRAINEWQLHLPEVSPRLSSLAIQFTH